MAKAYGEKVTYQYRLAFVGRYKHEQGPSGLMGVTILAANDEEARLRALTALGEYRFGLESLSLRNSHGQWVALYAKLAPFKE